MSTLQSLHIAITDEIVRAVFCRSQVAYSGYLTVAIVSKPTKWCVYRSVLKDITLGRKVSA